MRPVDEIQRVNGRLVFWQGYDPAVKTDLSSHAVATPEGWVIVDPIALQEEAMEELRSLGKVAAVVLTNGNHARAAEVYREKMGADIFAHEKARGEISIVNVKWLGDGEGISGLEALHLSGFAPGEIALYAPGHGGTMLMGDALINLESTGFVLLPEKYCDEPKAARESARKLLQFSFEVMTFAHGLPIVTGAGRRLEQLLQ
jgi:glyoxylase-like metal-dependent hydrolase (beta-lactamase superfamily II)